MCRSVRWDLVGLGESGRRCPVVGRVGVFFRPEKDRSSRVVGKGVESSLRTTSPSPRVGGRVRMSGLGDNRSFAALSVLTDPPFDCRPSSPCLSSLDF